MSSGQANSERSARHPALDNIELVAFDLDGTLVQLGKIKAQSYAISVQRMRGLAEPEPRAIEAYREIVGSAREAATRHVIENWT